MFLQSVKCLHYGTLRYVTWGWKTCISSRRESKCCVRTINQSINQSIQW